MAKSAADTEMISSCAPKHKEEKDWDDMGAFHVESKAHSRKIFVRSWFPRQNPDKPKALVFLMHGVNEHIGRYNGLAHVLTSKGFGVYGHDHVGHGASAGTMGDIEDFELLVKDFKQLVQSLSAKFTGVPVFVLGHSMGSLVAFHASYELEQESPGLLRGLIFSGFASVPGPSAASPFGLRCLFCLTQNESMSAKIGGFMARIAPRGDLAPVIVDQLTHDAEELEHIKTDPYHNRGQIQNRTGNEVLKAVRRARERMQEYRLPFLALHGSADTLTYPSGTQELFDRASSSDKAAKFYPNMYHEILLETDRDLVFDDVVSYILARLSADKNVIKPDEQRAPERPAPVAK